MLFVWIVVLLIAVALEAGTRELVAIWFIPGALVSLILSFIPAVPWWVQVLIFVLLGLVLVLCTRPLSRKLLEGQNSKTNVDALIGKRCIVTEEICNLQETGEVRVDGLCWSARADNADRVIAVGEQVEILCVQGVKLIVK